MNDFPNLPRQHRDTVHRRRDRFEGQTLPEAKAKKLQVRFSHDLNRFVNTVAHALRRYVKSRSDDGVVARGLVLDSDPDGSFYRLHYKMKMAREEGFGPTYREGQTVWIWALLHRRVASRPSDRWVTKIQFDLFWTAKSFPGETITPSLTPKENAEHVIAAAEGVAANIPGEQGKRIRAYLALARRRGFPQFLDLWYYNPTAVHAFAWESAAEQTRMIQRGGGHFPLSGKLAGNYQGGAPDWRIYPFKRLVLRYFQGTPDRWWLEEVDKDIGRSIQELVSAPGGKGAGGEAAVSQRVRDFRKHLIQLAKTPGNLYHESDRNTSDKRSFFERLP